MLLEHDVGQVCSDLGSGKDMHLGHRSRSNWTLRYVDTAIGRTRIRKRSQVIASLLYIGEEVAAGVLLRRVVVKGENGYNEEPLKETCSLLSQATIVLEPAISFESRQAHYSSMSLYPCLIGLRHEATFSRLRERCRVSLGYDEFGTIAVWSNICYTR